MATSLLAGQTMALQVSVGLSRMRCFPPNRWRRSELGRLAGGRLHTPALQERGLPLKMSCALARLWAHVWLSERRRRRSRRCVLTHSPRLSKGNALSGL